jgi:hypothetical protein
MRTEELRSLLHDRGDEVHDVGAPTRIGAVHDRVRIGRRRRAAAAGGVVVAAVAAIALAVVPGGTPSPGPAEVDPGPVTNGYTKDGVTFPAEANGRQLVGARVGDRGESELVFTAPAPEAEPGLQIAPVCFGPAADDHAVSVSVNGTFLFGLTCEASRPEHPAAEGTAGAAEIEEAVATLGLTPGEPMTVRVWLRDRSTDNTLVEHRDMVVGVGVYGRSPAESASGPAPESTGSPVAGTDLPDRIEHEGRTKRTEVASVEYYPVD